MATDKTKPDEKAPDPIDVATGARIRARRKALKISQQDLADFLKLTFQQVQKYERGANRVSISMVVRIAQRLRTSVAYLVGETANPDVLGSPETAVLPGQLARFLMLSQALRVAEAFVKLPKQQRQPAADLLTEMAGMNETEDAKAAA